MAFTDEKSRELIANFPQRAERAEAEALLRGEAVCAQYPDLRAVHEGLSGYGLKLLSALNGDEKTVEKRIAALKKENLELKKKQEKLLAAHGLAPDVFAVKYQCALCEDRGFSDGRMCDCLKRALNRLRAEESGLSKLFSAQSFENFDLNRLSDKREGDAEESDRAIMGGVVKRLLDYAAHFSTDSPNLLFVGGTGVGKTHLSSAIGKAAIERGFLVVYESAMQVVSSLEKERFAAEDKKDGTERVLSCDLLILDDLGTELPGSSSKSYLYYVLNTRLVRGLPTIVSTNLSHTQLEAQYEPRLLSRLLGDFEVILFAGGDMRRSRIG